MTDNLINNGTEMPDAGEPGLGDLLRLINDELTAGLQGQKDVLYAQENKEHKDIGRHICIELAGKMLAIPMSAVLEAGDLQQVQPLPLLPDWHLGITNIRGEIISVVNLALFLGQGNSLSANTRPYLVVQDDMIKIAVTIDRVVGTRSLYLPFAIPSESEAKANSANVFIGGRAIYKEHDGEQEIDLFDLAAFLSSPKLRDVSIA